MNLVSHDPRYRRTWMFQRNIRHISPWKLKIILFGVYNLTQDQKWDQETQNRVCKYFESGGIKRIGYQYDPHSGGTRTYAAQLSNLGLLFKREADSKIYLTRAGEDLLSGKPPLSILQAQILNHQYPSPNSLSQNTKIHPKIQIKPFIFILCLLGDKEIGTLSDKELMVPVVYGHNYGCFNLCKEKILSLRNSPHKEFENVLNSEDDMHTTRAKDRALSVAIRDVRDIANTCKNWLEASMLVNSFSENGEERIEVNEHYRNLIDQAIDRKNDFIRNPDNHESFQRQYGCWDRQKDTRHLGAATEIKLDPAQSIVADRFYQFCKINSVGSSLPEGLIESLVSELGIKRKSIIETLKPLLPHSQNYFETQFLEMSKSGGEQALEFESAVSNIFRNNFHFETEQTGQRTRAGKGGYSDAFVVALDSKHCGLLETKASSRYTLTSDDYYKMKSNYIPNYVELTKGRNLKLEFCLYIAGGFRGNIESDLIRLTSESNTPVSAIDAYDLLDISKKYPHQSDQPMLRNIFSKSKLLNALDFGSYQIEKQEFSPMDKAADNAE